MRFLMAGPVRCSIGCALLALSPLALAQTEQGKEGSGVRLSRSAICRQVEARAPVGEGKAFGTDVGELSAYTQVEGVTQPTRITHVWYHGDKEMYRRTIEIPQNGWRLWTSKKIAPSWTGPWKVEVLDEGGRTLTTLEFTIEEAAGEKAPKPGQ
jgi:hypothetical protein